MVLSWFGSGSKAASVTELIAARKYDKALELLKEQFKSGSRDPRLRLQMADVLVMANRGREAVPILVGLADEYASEGFAAKAIALFKKIDKIEPGRKDVEQKLAQLIQEPTGGVALRARPASEPAGTEIGLSFDAVSTEAPAPAPAPTAPADAEEEFPLTEEAFRDQVLDLVQETLHAPPVDPDVNPLEALTESDEGPMKSPLFGDFSPDELMAVMEGLRLLAFDAGDIIITEGEPGDSLFVLTTGWVKAWIRNPHGRHVQVRQMEEGSFFGEIALLTGKPRTATITAGAPCELLELDRPTLDSISEKHPRVLQVLEEFHRQRAGNAAEVFIRTGEGTVRS